MKEYKLDGNKLGEIICKLYEKAYMIMPAKNKTNCLEVAKMFGKWGEGIGTLDKPMARIKWKKINLDEVIIQVEEYKWVVSPSEKGIISQSEQIFETIKPYIKL